MPFYEKVRKYKIAPQAKFVKFNVKHFVEIPTIRHDKTVHPLLDCLKSSPPLNVSPPWLLKLSSCPPPAWLMTQKSFPPPPDPRGGGHYVYSIVEFKMRVLEELLRVLSPNRIIFVTAA